MLSRELDRRGINPPVDVLPSLSRLMNAGIGGGRTREDHRAVADQLYACVARGRELRQLTAAIGEAALSQQDRRYLAFADDFEQRFVGQNGHARTLEQTLDRAWELLARFPRRPCLTARAAASVITEARPLGASAPCGLAGGRTSAAK